MKQEHDRVKLHSTVMNTIFRESRDEEEATIKQTSGKRDSKDFRQGKSRTSFDARNIIEVSSSCFSSPHIMRVYCPYRSELIPFKVQ